MLKEMQAALSMLGRLGGAARTKALTPQQRQDIARHAANVRWNRYRAAEREQAKAERLKRVG